MPAYAELLPPELLEELNDLEWVSRMVARGLGGGIHPSRLAGRGEDFERHRPYQQGDDLRHLDWRLLARTDRLHVRRFRETSDLRALLVVDGTPSMGFRGEEGVGKLPYAIFIAAALGHLLRRAGDLPGLIVTGGPGGEPAVVVPPRPGREAWRAVLHALTRLETGDPAPLAPAVALAGNLLPRGGRVVVISDFLEDDEGAGVVREAGHLRARGDEVWAVRILTPEELGERGGGDALYHDPEHPDREVPGSPSRDPSYRRLLERYYGGLARALGDRGVAWLEARTTDPLLPLLRGWLGGGGPGARP